MDHRFSLIYLSLDYRQLLLVKFIKALRIVSFQSNKGDLDFGLL